MLAWHFATVREEVGVGEFSPKFQEEEFFEILAGAYLVPETRQGALLGVVVSAALLACNSRKPTSWHTSPSARFSLSLEYLTLTDTVWVIEADDALFICRRSHLDILGSVASWNNGPQNSPLCFGSVHLSNFVATKTRTTRILSACA
jgi:hypothetical protein